MTGSLKINAPIQIAMRKARQIEITSPAFSLDYALKDYGFVISTIKESNAIFSMIPLTHQMFAAASKAGFGRKDSSAIVLYVKKLAGMKLPKEND